MNQTLKMLCDNVVYGEGLDVEETESEPGYDYTDENLNTAPEAYGEEETKDALHTN